MQKMFEAVWQQGKIIPQEPVYIGEYTRLLVFVADEKDKSAKKADWRELKGRYKGKLSSVDQFLRFKQEEKELEG